MWYMHRTENPANEVQLLESPLKNKEKVLTELSKCILVCANCHREIHKNVGLE